MNRFLAAFFAGFLLAAPTRAAWDGCSAWDPSPLAFCSSAAVASDTDETITADWTFDGELSAQDDVVLGTQDNLSDSLWMFPTFRATSQTLFTLGSLDGKRWGMIGKSIYTPATGVLRDPSIKYHNGNWYIAHTTGTSTNSSFAVISSSDGLNWTHLASIMLAPSISGVNRVWSPEWFEDDDGTIGILISISTDAETTWTSFYVPASNDALSSYGTPVQITGVFPSKIIDLFMVKSDSAYNLFYKDESDKYIEIATSSSKLSGYVVAKANDHAGWGANLEGPSVVQIESGRWRIYMDAYTELGQYYAEGSSLLTWGSKTLTSMPYTFPHGNAYRVTGLKAMRNIVGMILSGTAMWGNNSGEAFFLGNVGAGTNDPVSRLHVENTSSGATARGIVLRNNANANNTGISIDLVPDTTDTALAKLVFIRTSQATGKMTAALQLWNGSALEQKGFWDNDGLYFPYSRTSAQLDALSPSAAGGLVYNSTISEVCQSTGTGAGAFIRLGNVTLVTGAAPACR